MKHEDEFCGGMLRSHTYPISTLSAPNGVTNIGGANVYAAKLATEVTVNVLGVLWFKWHTFTDDHCV